MSGLAEPFEFEFFVRGMVAATLVGVLCASVGVYVVLRSLAYIGHGLAHSIFGGAVVSFVSGISFYVGATLWGVFTVLLITGWRGGGRSEGRGGRDHHDCAFALGWR